MNIRLQHKVQMLQLSQQLFDTYHEAVFRGVADLDMEYYQDLLVDVEKKLKNVFDVVKKIS